MFSSGIHLSNMLPNPPNYNATMSMYPNGRPSVVMSSRILESSVDSPSQLPPPMELPPESSSFRSPPNYAQAAHRRITGNSTSVLSSFPTPHQNFGSSSRIIAAVGISPITPGYVPPGVNAISPMYQQQPAANSGAPSPNASNLPPAIPARMHEQQHVDVIQQQPPPQQPPPPLPPSLDLSAESSSVTVLSNAAPVL